MLACGAADVEVDVSRAFAHERDAVLARIDTKDLRAAVRIRGDLAAQGPGAEVVAPVAVGLPPVQRRVRDGVAFGVLDVEQEQERAIFYTQGESRLERQRVKYHKYTHSSDTL